jgi:hypothetical protein
MMEVNMLAYPDILQFSIAFLVNAEPTSIQANGREVTYKTGKPYSDSVDTGTVIPTEENWLNFWKTVEKLDVWGWRDRIKGPTIHCLDGTFANLSVLDGQGWSLQLKLDNKEINISASNAYPNVKGSNYGKTFRSFLEALNNLVGKDIFLIDLTTLMKPPEQQIQSVVFNTFTPTFSYRVKNGLPIEGKVLDEDIWNAAGVVYARTHEQDIVYIGKTNGRLKSRIKDHLRRIPKYEKAIDIEYRDWAEGKTVTIYAHKPENKSYLGLSIPIHVGLEHALIDDIKPRFVSRK